MARRLPRPVDHRTVYVRTQTPEAFSAIEYDPETGTYFALLREAPADPMNPATPMSVTVNGQPRTHATGNGVALAGQFRVAATMAGGPQTAQVLNVPLPHVYLQPEQPGEIAVANAQDKGVLQPSFVVRASLLQGRPEKEIAFVAARWLTFMRPDHFLKLALPTNTELKAAFLSAITMIKRDFPLPGDMRAAVTQYLPEMQKRIQPHMLEQLGMVVNRFIQAAPEVNLSKWGHAVDATSHRVGFVVCGDLEVAARRVSLEPVVGGGPPVKDKFKELVRYSLSEDSCWVRSHLGRRVG